MKYESDILKRLINTYGVVGNPCYISEIIKEFIVRGKECFPNLFTYQADWLAHIDEFGLNPSYTVSYTGQSIYAPNTLERPVKRAILKGQTLVNVLSSSNVKHIGTSTVNIEYSALPNPKNKLFIQIRFNQLPTLVDGANRFLKLEIYDASSANGSIELPISNMITGQTQKFILDVFNGEPKKKRFTSWMPQFASGTLDYDIVLIEYQEGMENWDIPYFEGMQSVKMPVLKTVGKNLFNYSDLVAGEVIWNTSNNVNIFEDGWYREGTDGVGFGLRKCIKVKPNTRYYANFPQTIHFMQYKANGDLIKGSYPDISTGYVTTSSETHYVNLFPSGGISSAWNESRRQEYQNCYISESEAMSSYEPYKSNILSTSEDVVLRGIGNVQDELDCLTGEIVQNIGEIVLNGSENYSRYNSACETVYGFSTALQTNSNEVNTALSDKLPVKRGNSVSTLDEEGIFFRNDLSVMYLKISKNKLADGNPSTLKAWLADNNITFIHQLKEKSVKTVDLTNLDQNGQNVKQLMSFNGGTHFNTGSLEGSPIPTLTVDVVTDLEETLMVCSSEGNTM